MIEVLNLRTGEILAFSNCIPSEAVIYAYLYYNGNRNTWEWQREYANRYNALTWGKKTVAYDDFAALTKPKESENAET